MKVLKKIVLLPALSCLSRDLPAPVGGERGAFPPKLMPVSSFLDISLTAPKGWAQARYADVQNIDSMSRFQYFIGYLKKKDLKP